MTGPRLLDLFSGAGGSAVGYHRAGFEVVGVDNRPQKHYPFEFHQADAFDYLRDHGHEFDVIHASPPCQAYSVLHKRWIYKLRAHPLTISYLREDLVKIGLPYVIENVPGSPLTRSFMLCGTAFGLRDSGGSSLWRHRIFESDIVFGLVPECRHNGSPVTVAGHAGGRRNRDGRKQHNMQSRREAMGIDWMTGDELSQAIPPAYTFWIGQQLLKTLNCGGGVEGHASRG
jgi:DNA (cytosine-5)-methyltransferase 1